MTPKQIAAIQSAFDTIDTVLDLQGEPPEDWFRWFQDRIWYDCRDAKAALEAILDDHYAPNPRDALETAKSQAMDTWLRCGRKHGDLVHVDLIHGGIEYEQIARARRRMDKSRWIYLLRKERFEDYDRAALEAAS